MGRPWTRDRRLGLGRLYRRRGRAEDATRELDRAAAMFAAMDMTVEPPGEVEVMATR